MHRFLLRLPLLILLGAGFSNGGDETLQNFKKYYGTYKDTPSRVEAILTLEGHEDAGVVEVLLPKLKEADSEIVRSTVRVLAAFKTRPPVEVLLAALKNDKTEATRTGILRALAEGKYSDVGPAVQSCLADKSWDVRRRAIQALVAGKTPGIEDLIAPACSDPEPGVRLTAIDALVNLGSTKVVAPAIVELGDSTWQVRKSAIDALTKVRSLDAIEPLIKALEKEEGINVPDIAEALASLTGKEFGAAVDKWKAWWAEAKAGFALPAPEAIAYLRTRHDAHTGGPPREYLKTGVVEYHGIDTPSRSMLFVIDVSGSMESVVTEKERFEAGHYPSFKRIDIVKTELQRTIDHLEPYVNFNILAFATDINSWKKQLVPANVLNKSAAKEWAGHLEAIGGNSKEDLATAGLAGSANLDKGKTNTYGALMTALNIRPGPHTGEKGYTVDVDTIFFLSDGRPTVGEFVDPDDILRELLAANELRKVKIHTIAIGEFQKDFMRKIAEKTGGIFVDLGK
jgi:HEAT repeat protein